MIGIKNVRRGACSCRPVKVNESVANEIELLANEQAMRDDADTAMRLSRGDPAAFGRHVAKQHWHQSRRAWSVATQLAMLAPPGLMSCNRLRTSPQYSIGGWLECTDPSAARHRPETSTPPYQTTYT